MGSRSRNHNKGGVPRRKIRQPRGAHRVPCETHFDGQKAVYAHLKDYPGSTLREVADACGMGLAETSANLNALKNKRLVARGEDRYETKELFNDDQDG